MTEVTLKRERDKKKVTGNCLIATMERGFYINNSEVLLFKHAEGLVVLSAKGGHSVIGTSWPNASYWSGELTYVEKLSIILED